MKKIPTRYGKKVYGDKFKDHYIEYDNQVMIIKSCDNGNYAQYQYDGVCCRQGSITGKVVFSFDARKYKWFNPNWWYKKTAWCLDKTRIYFKERSHGNIYDKFANKTYKHESGDFKMITTKKAQKQLNKAAFELSVSTEKILNCIFRKIQKETGLYLVPDFEDLSYGVNWFEACIPVRDRHTDEKYLVTWNNCD